MKEKELVQRATVDAFVRLYNERHGTNYGIVKYGDVPDAICKNSQGKTINLEVTITEDRKGDIPWVLGKIHERPSKVRVGSCLTGNVLSQLFERLDKKLKMRYGNNTALVVRDSSGVDWDWEEIASEVGKYLSEAGNPYDKDIWIVNRSKDRLHKIA